MSYTPTNWDSGDIITAEKLNKIEQGISEVSSSYSESGSSIRLLVNATYENPQYIGEEIRNPDYDPSLPTYYSYDKTFGEIYEYFPAVAVKEAQYNGDWYLFTLSGGISYEGGQYRLDTAEGIAYGAANEYPKVTVGGGHS